MWRRLPAGGNGGYMPACPPVPGDGCRMRTGPLAGRFRVIAVDNRGAGRSAKPPGPYSIEQMAADVAGLMDRLDLPRAHLLGISMGGRIALALALAQPARVDRLLPVATSPRAAGARWLVRAGRRAHRVASVGAISSLAIRPARSAKRSVRSTSPPGKLPSRWMYTS
jgi:pimeloyl-ACP methyl ester carboxylesterase